MPETPESELGEPKGRFQEVVRRLAEEGKEE